MSHDGQPLGSEGSIDRSGPIPHAALVGDTRTPVIYRTIFQVVGRGSVVRRYGCRGTGRGV